LLAPEELPEDARRAVTGYLWTLLGGGLAAMFAAFALDDCLAAAGAPRDGYLGYSNGENAALLTSGLLRLKLRQLGGAMERVRGGRRRTLSPPPAGDAVEPTDGDGVNLAVAGPSRAAVEEVLGRFPGQAFLALDNCPSQVVVFTARPVAAAVRRALRGIGALVVRLPYDRPIHTPLFAGAEEIVDDLYGSARPEESPVPVYSSGAAAPIDPRPEAVRARAIALWTQPVRFRETVLRAWDDGYRVFVEAGPGGALSGFVTDTLRGRDAEALPTDLRHRQTLRQLQQVLGRLFTLGAAIDLAPLLPPGAGEG
jgi:acyl transferase domain-containing protein